MSIMIKGIKFPDVGVRDVVIAFANHCLLITDECGRELFYGEYVEIPTPHGRLIDADELYEQFINEFCNRNCDESVRGEICDRCGVLRAINMIKSAPTIIEAEVSE